LLDDREMEIVQSIGRDSRPEIYEQEFYTEKSRGYMRRFLENIAEDYNSFEFTASGEESFVYKHPDDRHVWATYSPDSVKLKGDDQTIERSEEILGSETPRIAYVRNRAIEEGSRATSALETFSGLFSD
jgi:hypothetical protein